MEVRILALIKILTERNNGSAVISLDVPKAYYQTDLPYDTRIFIRLPEPYGVKRIIKVIHGLKKGARLWNQKADEIFEKISLKKRLPGLFMDNNSTFMRYMDDLTASIKKEASSEYIEALGKEIVLDEIVDGFPTKFLGLSLTDIGDQLRLSMKAFLDSIDFEEKAEVRTWVGRLGWIANFYPHLKIVHQNFASRAMRESEIIIEEARRALLKARKQDFQICLTGISKPQLRVFTDASFNREDFSGICGVLLQLADEAWEITRNENIMFHKSVRIPRLIKSTFATELEGLVRGLGWSILGENMIDECFANRSRTRMFVDSRALCLVIENKSTEDQFSKAMLQFCIQQAGVRNVQPEWCSTIVMKADCLTKIQSSPNIYQESPEDNVSNWTSKFE